MLPELGNSVFLRCQFSWNWYVASAQSQLKSQKPVFEEIDQLILKFKRNSKGPRTSETTFKKSKVGGLTLLDFWTSRLISPHKYGQLIFKKGANAIQWRKGNLFNNGAETTGYPYAKKLNFNSYFTPYTKLFQMDLDLMSSKLKRAKGIDENVMEIELKYTAGRYIKWYKLLWKKQLAISYKVKYPCTIWFGHSTPSI